MAGAVQQGASPAKRRCADRRAIVRAAQLPRKPGTLMRSTIGKKSVRVFTNALKCLAAVGEELIIETTRERVLILRTLSQSQSSYAQVRVLPEFFSASQFDEPLKCKVNLKTVARSLTGVAKVESFVVALSHEQSTLAFQMQEKSGLRREYRFAFEDQPNILQADFAREAAPNRLCTRPGVLSDCLDNFQNREEITLVPARDSLLVKTYVDERAAGSRQVLRTECSINKENLALYEVRDADFGTELTFCMKELAAILAFCNTIELDLRVFFQRGGAPIILSNSERGEEVFVVDIVIATLRDERDDVKDPGAIGGGADPAVGATDGEAAPAVAATPAPIAAQSVASPAAAAAAAASGAPVAPARPFSFDSHPLSVSTRNAAAGAAGFAAAAPAARAISAAPAPAMGADPRAPALRGPPASMPGSTSTSQSRNVEHISSFPESSARHAALHSIVTSSADRVSEHARRAQRRAAADGAPRSPEFPESAKRARAADAEASAARRLLGDVVSGVRGPLSPLDEGRSERGSEAQQQSGLASRREHAQQRDADERGRGRASEGQSEEEDDDDHVRWGSPDAADELLPQRPAPHGGARGRGGRGGSAGLRGGDADSDVVDATPQRHARRRRDEA